MASLFIDKADSESCFVYISPTNLLYAEELAFVKKIFTSLIKGIKMEKCRHYIKHFLGFGLIPCMKKIMISLSHMRLLKFLLITRL